jgi:hypothetical protein
MKAPVPRGQHASAHPAVGSTSLEGAGLDGYDDEISL